MFLYECSAVDALEWRLGPGDAGQLVVAPSELEAAEIAHRWYERRFSVYRAVVGDWQCEALAPLESEEQPRVVDWKDELVPFVEVLAFSHLEAGNV